MLGWTHRSCRILHSSVVGVVGVGFVGDVGVVGFL